MEYMQDLWINGHKASYEQILQKVGTHSALVSEYNALINAVPESWKIKMNSNNFELIIPQEIISELDPLSELYNKEIRKKNIYKLINHDIIMRCDIPETQTRCNYRKSL